MTAPPPRPSAPPPSQTPEPSPAAKRKAATRLTDDRLHVQSFRSLLRDLATLTRNTVRLPRGNTFQIIANPTPVQRRALELLHVKIDL